MAEGKVCIGYSRPWVAKYTVVNGTVTITDAMRMGRGVGVEINVEAIESDVFRADDQDAEVAPRRFKSGTGKYTIDGLKREAAKLIYGNPDPDNDGWTHEGGDDAEQEYMATGFLKTYMEDGVITHQPVIIWKQMFEPVGDSAQTMEENIDWQTQDLESKIVRSDYSNHSWRWRGPDNITDEDQAEAMIKAKFNVA